MKQSFKTLIGITSIVAATFSVQAAPMNFDDITAQAKKEGTLTWYATYDPTIMKQVGDSFQAKYGIPIKIFRGPSGTILQRYNTERDAKNTVADVLQHSVVDDFTKASSAGEFVNLQEANLPSMTKWPKEDLFGKVAITVGVWPFVIGYNTNLVKGNDIPKTWSDVLKHKKEKIIAHTAWDSSPTYVEFLEMLKDQFGDDLVKQIGTLKTVAYHSAVPAAQAVAAGEQAYVFGSFPAFITPLKSKGAPIDFVIPKVTTGNIAYAGVPTAAPHRNAGLLFLNFLMSEEGQMIIAKSGGASPLGAIPGAVSLGEGYVRPNVSGAIKNRDELIRWATGK